MAFRAVRRLWFPMIFRPYSRIWSLSRPMNPFPISGVSPLIQRSFASPELPQQSKSKETEVISPPKPTRRRRVFRAILKTFRTSLQLLTVFLTLAYIAFATWFVFQPNVDLFFFDRWKRCLSQRRNPKDPLSTLGVWEWVFLDRLARNVRCINTEQKKHWEGLRKGTKMSVKTKLSRYHRDMQDAPPRPSGWLGWMKDIKEFGKNEQNSYVVGPRGVTRFFWWVVNWLVPIGSVPADESNFVYSATHLRHFKGIVVADGIKGSGKTCAVLSICSHLMQNGDSALYFNFSKDKNEEPGRKLKRAKEILLKNPEKISAFASSVGLLVVLDDFDVYAKDPNTKENSELILAALAYGMEKHMLKVIITTSDPNYHSQQLSKVQTYRITKPAPQPGVLKRLIQETLKRKGLSAVEGNGDEDITMYCEVVGTYGDLNEKYLKNKDSDCHSVRDVTLSCFKESVKSVRAGLEKVAKLESETLKKPKKRLEMYTPKMLHDFLRNMLRQKVLYFTPNTGWELYPWLREAGIVRNIGHSDLAAEPISFSREVALRALLGLPATNPPRLFAESAERKRDYFGRGSEKTIEYLTNKMQEFQAEKQAVEALFKGV